MHLSALVAPRQPARRRWLLAPLLLLLPVLGLGSRSKSIALPVFVVAYAGDTLWTVMMYVTLLFLWPRLPIARVAGLSVGLSFLVEFSQLIHTPLLDAVRAHWLGALFLGRGFLVSDLVCYSIGALAAAAVDGLLCWRVSTP